MLVGFSLTSLTINFIRFYYMSHIEIDIKPQSAQKPM